MRRSIICVILALCSILGGCRRSKSVSYETFVRDMYERHLYEDESFLLRHCSPELLQKLRDNYPYEGDGYAVWAFRSGAQDGPSQRYGLTEVRFDGEWCTYIGYDMGVEFLRCVKLYDKNGVVMMEDVCGFEPLQAPAFADVIADTTVVRLDVRTPDEFSAGHIDGALNVDVQGEDFASRMEAVVPDRNTVLAVYCRSGRRSKTACEILSKMGYSGYELDGGYLSW
ncbi:MAG: rhodanese-like domain-containing protein [Bacteroidales bacterium]|nr:rhodanese-like domain-containing protein [Candidatus Cryptobacteroides equifaecalis]